MPDPNDVKKPPEKKAPAVKSAAQRETEERIKNINSMSTTIMKFKSDMDDKVLEVKKLADAKGVEQISTSTNRVMNRLSETIGALSVGVKKITVDTAKATKESVAQYGRAISEDISFNKQNVVHQHLLYYHS